jgi:hypothetical protein
MALGSLNHPNVDVRAYIGRTLKQADQSFLNDVRISRALGELRKDPNQVVRGSVSW